MLFIPLPFVLTLLLCIILFRLYQQRETLPSSQLFLTLISTYTLGTALVGIRWGYGITAVQPIMAVCAVSWAILAWLCFRSLTIEGASISWRKDYVHALPVVAVLLQILLMPDLIDIFIIATDVFYGYLLLKLARQGQSALKTVRLEQVTTVHKGLYATAYILMLFAVLDVVIFIDIEIFGGKYAASLITFANIPMIFALGFVASLASQSQPQTRVVEANGESVLKSVPDQSATKETDTADTDLSTDKALVERLDKFMRETELYKDVDLNLAKLARKFGIPTRQISAAVNKVKSVNVSQYVNAYRVQALCELLESSDQPIIQLQLETGFQTKSNCNREFLRVTGLSPSQWREQKRQPTS
jgi:AraC-like DNA-binding protein